MRKVPIIAVDGPAGSGKSTICRLAAHELGFDYFSTGLIYRALGAIAAREGIDINDAPSLEKIAETFARSLRWDPHTQTIHYGQIDISSELESAEAGMRASLLAKFPRLRELLLPVQRNLGNDCDHGLIIDGRDIGTVIFPDATLKIFMTASLEERAARRLQQLAKVTPENKLPSLSELIAEIDRRDLQDSKRDAAPLKSADDAIAFDTSAGGVDVCVGRLVALIRKHLR